MPREIHAQLIKRDIENPHTHAPYSLITVKRTLDFLKFDPNFWTKYKDEAMRLLSLSSKREVYRGGR